MKHKNLYDEKKVNDLVIKIEEKIGFVSEIDKEYVHNILTKYLINKDCKHDKITDK
jgi:hypothetical protein